MSLFDYVFSGTAPHASTAVLVSRDTRERIEVLEKQVGELALLTRALMVALEEKGCVSHARLREIMDKIDAEDGVVDGQVTSPRAKKKAAAKSKTRPAAPKKNAKG